MFYFGKKLIGDVFATAGGVAVGTSAYINAKALASSRECHGMRARAFYL